MSYGGGYGSSRHGGGSYSNGYDGRNDGYGGTTYNYDYSNQYASYGYEIASPRDSTSRLVIGGPIHTAIFFAHRFCAQGECRDAARHSMSGGGECARCNRVESPYRSFFSS